MGVYIFCAFLFGLPLMMISETAGAVGIVLGCVVATVVTVVRWREDGKREHRAALRREAKDRRKLNSATWRRTREAVLRRDCYQCVKCGRGAEDVDHIRPRAMGGDLYALSNLQSLCKPCHRAKSGKEALTIRRFLDGR